jgi:hypothetical protein
MSARPRTNERLVEEGRLLIAAADGASLPLRLFGGVAIWLRSSERVRSLLRRDFADLDFVAHRSSSRALRELLEHEGYLPERTFNAAHGASRLLYHAPDHAFHIDIFLDRFEMSHKLDFESRLELEPLTLTAADLLLAKLQVAEINRKDLTDAAMLLLDHELGERDGRGECNAAYVAGLCARDWGLYTTLTDNLAALGAVVDEIGLQPTDTLALADRSDRLLQLLQQAPKSRSWNLRAKIGRRKRWYETPEEVIR